ncbi:hypothetical protein BGZ92_010346, partial [Podila epicladia]
MVSKDDLRQQSSSTIADTPFDTLEKPQDIENQNEMEGPTSSSDPPHNLTRTKLILLFLGLALCVFLACLDVSIIATALPRIASDFSAQSQMSW